ncbi:MAG: thiamine phosphate synthase [Acidobacteriaceae bacterium]|nr:thiamine phosphate synthase [Acidobacteriaceae bacterium]
MPVAFELPRFYPILDSKLLAQVSCPALAAAEGLIDGGARILQFRHKEDWTLSEFDTARKMAKLCHESGVLFVINDRADFATMLGAALHVGQDDLQPVAARRVIGDEVMGFSTHNHAQLSRGNEEPVEYLSLGPIFATTSKDNPDPVVGVETLRKLRELTAKPLVAIGGITQLNGRDVLEAGANSLAIVSGLFNAERVDRTAIRKSAQNWIALLAQARAAVQ